MQVGQVFVKLAVDMSGFNQDIQQAGSGLEKVSKQGDGLLNTLKNIAKSAAGFAAGMVAFQGLQATFKGLVDAGIGWNAQLEVSNQKWVTLLGTQAAATEQLNWLKDFAAATPFEFQELDEAAVRMKAMGFSTDETRKLMQTLGDTAAATGTGAEGLNRITYALGQMRAATRVNANDMMQLTSMGIPAWQMLADAMGMSVAEVRKLSEKGLIPAEKAIPALTAGLDKAFGGAMQKQASTFLGRISTLKDEAKSLLGDAFQPSFGWLKDVALPAISETVARVGKAFKSGGWKGAFVALFPPEFQATAKKVWAILTEIFNGVVEGAKIAWDGLQPVVNILKSLFNWAVQTFGWMAENGSILRGVIAGVTAAFITLAVAKGILAAIAAAQWALNVAMTANPIGLVVAAIAGLIAVGVILVKNFETIKYHALQVWGKIKAFVADAVASLIEKYAGFVEVFSDSMAQEARAKAASLRAQAQSERAFLAERESTYEADQQAKAAAEENKRRAADQTAYHEARKVEETASGNADAFKQEADAFGAAQEVKKDYLDEFDREFDRAADSQTTTFERNQEDQLAAFKAKQDEQLAILQAEQEQERIVFDRYLEDKKTAFDRALESESVSFKRAQDDRLSAFKNAQADALTSFKYDLEDRRAIFDEAISAEKEAFSRAQEDQLNIFRNRQRDEVDALKERHSIEMDLLDSQYGGQIDALKAQQDALKDQEKAEDNARRLADAEEKIAKARKELQAAMSSGDLRKVEEAQDRLTELEEEAHRERQRQARQAQTDSLNDQIEALRRQHAQAKEALKDRQTTEQGALQESQSQALLAYQRQLEDARIAHDNLLALRREANERELSAEMEKFSRAQELSLEAFNRAQEDEQTRFEQAQEERRTRYERELDDLKQALLDKQEAQIEGFKAMQAQEEEAFKRRLEDAKTRFKQELQDLKNSLKDKLAAQQAYLNDLSKLQAKIAKAASDNVVQTPTPTPSPVTPGGGGGNHTVMSTPAQQQKATETLSNLDTVKAKAKAGDTKGAAELLSKISGLTLEQAMRNIIDTVPHLAKGGVAYRPTLALIGERGPERVEPLRKGATEGRGGMQTILVTLDGREVARSTVRYIPGELVRVGVRA